MGKRILVTGGAGFLGSHLCERLLDAGHELRTRGGVAMEPAEIAGWLLDGVIARVADMTLAADALKLLAKMRQSFGGHAVTSAGKPPP